MGAVGSPILVKNSKADMMPYRQDALFSRKGKHTLKGGGLGIDNQPKALQGEKILARLNQPYTVFIFKLYLFFFLLIDKGSWSRETAPTNCLRAALFSIRKEKRKRR